jgi:quercetin dioxygenase-like cupin family protein
MTPLQRPNHAQDNAIFLSGLTHGPDLDGDDDVGLRIYELGVTLSSTHYSHSNTEVVFDDDDDERIWVEHRDQVWTRPLCLNVSNGYWTELLRVRKSGVLHRHRHPNPVHGLVLKGRWHYLEHDWVAEEGSYVFEPPGETHTLIVPEGVDEMITFFHVTGCLYYIDPDGNPLGYDDVFTLIDDCRAYYTKVGLGADFVDQFIR